MCCTWGCSKATSAAKKRQKIITNSKVNIDVWRQIIWYTNISHSMTKPTEQPLRLAKTQISLGIFPVWSVFAVRMKRPWVLSYPLSAQQILWSDWVDAQADPSLHWAHKSIGFVMCWLIWNKEKLQRAVPSTIKTVCLNEAEEGRIKGKTILNKRFKKFVLFRYNVTMLLFISKE